MTEREKYLNHRIDHLREMIRELERERDDIRRKRTEAYYQQLDGCNPAIAEATND